MEESAHWRWLWWYVTLRRNIVMLVGVGELDTANVTNAYMVQVKRGLQFHSQLAADTSSGLACSVLCVLECQWPIST